MGFDSDMIEWSKKTGLLKFSPATGEVSLEWIAQWTMEKLRDLSADELFAIILKINAYNLYLKTEKGSILAQLNFKQQQFGRGLYRGTNSLGEHGKWKNKEERECLVLDANPKLIQIENEIVLLKAKYSKIKEVTEGIDNISNILKSFYHRQHSQNQSTRKTF